MLKKSCFSLVGRFPAIRNCTRQKAVKAKIDAVRLWNIQTRWKYYLITCFFMEKVLTSVDELNTLITNAVHTALEAHEKELGETKLISRDAAAKRLGVDVSTLWRWNKSGFLKVSTYLGRKPLYSSKVIERLERGEIEIK